MTLNERQFPPFADVRTNGEVATSLEYRASFDGKAALDRAFVDLQVPAGTPKHDDLQKLLNAFNDLLKASGNFFGSVKATVFFDANTFKPLRATITMSGKKKYGLLRFE